MDRPFNSRTIINEGPMGITIEIPVDKNPLTILGFSILIVFLFFGMVYFTGHSVGVLHRTTQFEFFRIFPFLRVIVFIGLIFLSITYWLWLVDGREILTINTSILRVTRKNSIFFSPQEFNLAHITEIKFNFLIRGSNLYHNSIINPWRLDNLGSIMFFYNHQVYTLANGIQENEAIYLLDFLKKKGVINYNAMSFS